MEYAGRCYGNHSAYSVPGLEHKFDGMTLMRTQTEKNLNDCLNTTQTGNLTVQSQTTSMNIEKLHLLSKSFPNSYFKHIHEKLPWKM